MTYDLAIGDRAYSSWSLRSWLLFHRFGIPVRTERAQFYSDDFPALLDRFPPARLVPVMRTPDGAVIWDTLAIAEELSERHPDAGLWPDEPEGRGTARALCAEMHSGFAALRSDCPMNLRVAYADFRPSEPVLGDLARIETLWAHARGMAENSPWLFGRYSIADAFFAPVAARIAGYGLPVGEGAQAYINAHLADAAFRRWRAMGMVDGPDQAVYAMAHQTRPWPGPEVRAARVADGPSENAACPYSGEPVTHFLKTEGRVFGFCNAFCRDKTLADPDAWPEFTALLERSC